MALDKSAVARVMVLAIDQRTPLGVYTSDGTEIRSGDVINCWVGDDKDFDPCPKYVQGFRRVAFYAYMGTEHAGLIRTDLDTVVRAEGVTQHCSLAEPMMIIHDYASIMPTMNSLAEVAK